MTDLSEEAEAEAERRWPSPNSALYEGIHIGFKLGAKWASEVQSGVTDEFLDEDGMGYVIEQSEHGYRHVWKEPGEPDDESIWYETRAGAICSARDDWHLNGQGDNWAPWSKRLAAAASDK